MTSRRPAHRGSADGRAYLDLRARAKADGRTSAEYLRLYALEGFVARLAASVHRDRLVLKGGVLLAAYDLRRPTADIDFAARHQSNAPQEVLQLVADIIATPLTSDTEDGLVFDPGSARAETIREDDAYSGVRVTLLARLATARERFHVDVNVGDPIFPAPSTVSVPRLLGGEIRLLGYPIEMILAEKAVTAMQRGTASTRWRDFADIFLLTGHHVVLAAAARHALVEVARHRQTEPVPLRPVLEGYDVIGQERYRHWRDRLDLADRLPDAFSTLLEATFAFVDPLLEPDRFDHAQWDSTRRQWATKER